MPVHQPGIGGVGAGEASVLLDGSARLSVRAAAWWLVLSTAALAGSLAALIAWWAGPVVWAAPLAAALGVGLAALPVAALVARLAPSVAPAPAAAAPAVSVSPLAPSSLTRELFLELAGREWARARRYGSGAALLVVQVDRFARLVETHGTAVTDALITELLRQTAPTLRGADIVTRFAEEQLAVFLSPADATGALDVAERIRERAEQLELPRSLLPSLQVPLQGLRITVSVGVAHLRPAHLNLQALVDDATDAVQVARQAGGNCVRGAPVESISLGAPGNWINDNRARPN
jgi:diguanylate cyclase (GGDEF)-like protein